MFSFSIGATLYYVVLYRARLIPVWLTLWGVLGALLVFITAMGTLVDGPPYAIEGAATALALPIATQEIALALWLIARGFEDRGSPSTPRPRAA